jgi:hypothetical protein
VTPEQRRARAYAAQALMDDPTLQAGWDAIEADLIAEWRKPAPWHDDRAKAARERIWTELQMLANLRQRLASFAGQARD